MIKQKKFSNGIKINGERCKGCQLCINFCPNKVLVVSKKINKKGFHTAEILDQKKCTGCGICFLVCPDTAIEIYKSDEK